LWRMEVLLLSFLFYLLCLGMSPFMSSMHNSEEVCDSILVIMMNMYYPHIPFTSTNWRAAYQRLWAPQTVSLITPLSWE
jgi:hypothetical protein